MCAYTTQVHYVFDIVGSDGPGIVGTQLLVHILSHGSLRRNHSVHGICAGKGVFQKGSILYRTHGSLCSFIGKGLEVFLTPPNNRYIMSFSQKSLDQWPGNITG